MPLLDLQRLEQHQPARMKILDTEDFSHLRERLPLRQ